MERHLNDWPKFAIGHHWQDEFGNDPDASELPQWNDRAVEMHTECATQRLNS